MTPEEHQWHINLIKSRYHSYNLTFEQAERVYQYEEDKMIYSDKHYFSYWEEHDYELSVFKEILKDDQLAMYEQHQKEAIAVYEKETMEADQQRVNDIHFLTEGIQFCQESFLPDFFNNSALLMVNGFFRGDQSKINFLKAEYKTFLNDRKKEILVQHFRHYRTLCPNALKAELLRHKGYCLWPDYLSFQHHLDEPAKAIAQYLKRKLSFFPKEADEFIKSKQEELRAFNESISKKYYEEREGGWHVITVEYSSELLKEDRVMSFLLLDKDGYGFIK